MKVKMKCDMHVHSFESRDCGMSYPRIASCARKKGIGAVVIANHNVAVPELPDMVDGVRFIPAVEYSTDVGHVLALFVRETVEAEGVHPDGKVYPFRETAEAVRRQGGFAVFAHPFEYRREPPEDAFDVFDGIEAYNSRAGYARGGQANELAEKSLREGQFATAGSDAHLPFEVGRSYVELDCPADAGKSDIIKALHTGEIVSRPTPPYAMAMSQIYKGITCGQPGLLPKNILKFFYGVCCSAAPWIFGIKPGGKNN